MKYQSYDNKKIQDFLKPRLGKIKQGYYKPTNPDKFNYTHQRIIYRSKWEFDFLYWCDHNDVVIKCISEPFFIKYLSPIDKKIHRYYIDFYVEFQKNGSVDKWLIEVKPERHTKRPNTPKRKTKKSISTFLTMYKTYKINIAKFKAASEYAAINGWKFGVIELINNNMHVIDWKKNVQ